MMFSVHRKRSMLSQKNPVCKKNRIDEMHMILCMMHIPYVQKYIWCGHIYIMCLTCLLHKSLSDSPCILTPPRITYNDPDPYHTQEAQHQTSTANPLFAPVASTPCRTGATRGCRWHCHMHYGVEVTSNVPEHEIYFAQNCKHVVHLCTYQQYFKIFSKM